MNLKMLVLFLVLAIPAAAQPITEQIPSRELPYRSSSTIITTSVAPGDQTTVTIPLRPSKFVRLRVLDGSILYRMDGKHLSSHQGMFLPTGGVDANDYITMSVSLTPTHEETATVYIDFTN